MFRPRAKLRARRIAAVAAFLLSLVLVPAVFPAPAIAESDVATVQAAVNAWRADREAAIVELLSIPNVASNLPDMERNADHIIGMLEQRGFSTRLLRAGGAPFPAAR